MILVSTSSCSVWRNPQIPVVLPSAIQERKIVIATQDNIQMWIRAASQKLFVCVNSCFLLILNPPLKTYLQQHRMKWYRWVQSLVLFDAILKYQWYFLQQYRKGKLSLQLKITFSCGLGQPASNFFFRQIVAFYKSGPTFQDLPSATQDEMTLVRTSSWSVWRNPQIPVVLPSAIQERRMVIATQDNIQMWIRAASQQFFFFLANSWFLLILNPPFKTYLQQHRMKWYW